MAWEKQWRFLAVDRWKVTQDVNRDGLKQLVTAELTPINDLLGWASAGVTSEQGTVNDKDVTGKLIPGPTEGRAELRISEKAVDFDLPNRRYQMKDKAPPRRQWVSTGGGGGATGKTPQDPAEFHLAGKARGVAVVADPKSYRQYSDIQLRLRIFNPAPATLFPGTISTADPFRSQPHVLLECRQQLGRTGNHNYP